MKHLSKVALSASVMIVVAQAMSTSAIASPGKIEVPRFDDIAGVSGLDVFGRAEVMHATGTALPDLVSGYTLEGKTLLERFDTAQVKDFVNDGGSGAMPDRVRRNVAKCHNACHRSGGYC